MGPSMNLNADFTKRAVVQLLHVAARRQCRAPGGDNRPDLPPNHATRIVFALKTPNLESHP
jgi:hypothetical protein